MNQKKLQHQNSFDRECSLTKEKYKKKFMYLVLGQFISSIGSGLTDFGLAIYVLAMTGSVMSAAIVSICAFLPSILLAPIGGVLADHYDRRKMMMLGELLSGVGLVICIATILSSNPSFVVICIGVGVSSVFTALTEPAFKATVTDLLTEEDFAKAGGMVSIANNAKLLISPAIAGLLLQVTTVSTLIIIDILTFFTTVGVILIVKKGMITKHNEHSNTSFLNEMKEGIVIVRQHKGIVAMIVVMTIAGFCFGVIQTLSKPLILAFAGDTELGILTSVCAFGMMAGSILISCLKKIKSYVKLLAVGLIGSGIFFALMGIREDTFWIAGAGFMMFSFMPAVQIGAEVLIRKNLANEVQGRAFGIISFITQLGSVVAFISSGALADYVFEPLMTGDSFLALSIGNVIGQGKGRGIALLLFIFGVTLAIIGIVVAKLKQVKSLEEEKENHEVIVETCEAGL